MLAPPQVAILTQGSYSEPGATGSGRRLLASLPPRPASYALTNMPPGVKFCDQMRQSVSKKKFIFA